jgi:hypothetical protein
MATPLRRKTIDKTIFILFIFLSPRITLFLLITDATQPYENINIEYSFALLLHHPSIPSSTRRGHGEERF